MGQFRVQFMRQSGSVFGAIQHTLIKKAVQVSMSEIEAASCRQQLEQQAAYELKVRELDAKIEAAKVEFFNMMEEAKTKHEQELERDKVKVRKTAYQEIAKTIKEVAGQALKESNGAYNVKHALYNCAAMFGSLTVFAIVYKLFT